MPTDISAIGLSEIERSAKHLGDIDLIINSTSLGLQQGSMPFPADLVEDRVCYDMGYGGKARFAEWARANGALRAADGLGMLIEQAAESFRLWHGLHPQTDSIYHLLRNRV